MINTQFSNTKPVLANIKAFKLDNASEFKLEKWANYYKNKGYINEYTSPYSPSQNGIAERLNRFLIERLISVCKERNIPIYL
ncbi:hypothetical protein PZA11_006245 [Diplocarpon coronariae]